MSESYLFSDGAWYLVRPMEHPQHGTPHLADDGGVKRNGSTMLVPRPRHRLKPLDAPPQEVVEALMLREADIVKRLRATNDELRKRIVELKESNNRLNAERRKHDQRIEGLEKQARNMGRSIRDVQEERDRLRADRDNLRAERDRLNKQLDEYEELVREIDESDDPQPADPPFDLRRCVEEDGGRAMWMFKFSTNAPNGCTITPIKGRDTSLVVAMDSGQAFITSIDDTSLRNIDRERSINKHTSFLWHRGSWWQIDPLNPPEDDGDDQASYWPHGLSAHKQRLMGIEAPPPEVLASRTSTPNPKIVDCSIEGRDEEDSP